MAVKTRIDAFDRDIALIIERDLSPKGQSAALANFANQELARGQARNRSALGFVPPHRTFVDQSEGAPVESVKPNSTVVFEFELLETALAVIGEMLVKASPVKSGRFQRSHLLFADGVEVEPGRIPPNAEEYAFLSSVPYARKLERGLSPQAPDGVWHATAVLAARRYGNIARIRFGFRSLPAGAIGAWSQTASARALAKNIRGGRESLHTEWLTRQPAIIVSPGR